MDHISSYIRKAKRGCFFAIPMVFFSGLAAEAIEPVYTEAELAQVSPTSSNPYLSFLPSQVTPDYAYWNSALYWGTRNTPVGSYSVKAPVILVEEESLLNPNDPGFVSNNSILLAQPIPELSTDTADHVQINATFRPGTFITTIVEEDNGAMLRRGDTRTDVARPVETNVTAGFMTAALSTIGDGPHGSAGSGEGDFDYYSTSFLPEGVILEIDVDTIDTGFSFNELNAFIILRNSSGEIVAFDEDKIFGGSDSYIKYVVEDPDTYYISVSSFQGFFFADINFPLSPYESGSGGGAATEGDYGITIRVSDLDFFSVDMNEGDVLSFGTPTSNTVLNARLINPGGSTILATDLNVSFLYSENHPYITNDPIHGSVVAPDTGTYAIAYSGSEAADYTVDLKVLRPVLDDTPDVLKQTLYLTFWGTRFYNGAENESVLAGIPFNPSTYDLPLFGETYPDIDVTLQPFFEFLEPLGFEVDDGDEPIAMAIMSSYIRDLVQIQLPEVTVIVGIKPDSTPEAAEILVGGTTVESGFFTIGRAQSIDVGNFEPEEQAFVLMDFLSGTGPFLTDDAIPLYNNEFDLFWAESSDQDITDLNHDRAYTKLVATTVANIITHEAGHFFGDFHTENVSTPLNIMDSGGRGVTAIAGFGSDRRFNTVDDIAVPLGPDLYDPAEFFIGTEDTDKTIFFGVGAQNPVPINFGNLFVNFATANNGIGTPLLPFNALQGAIDVIDDGGTINISPSSGGETFSDGDRIDSPMTLVNSDPAVGSIRIGDETLPRYLKTKR